MTKLSCVPGTGGAPGTLAANFTSAEGVLLGARSVVASCDVSALSDMGSCPSANKASVTRVDSLGGVALRSAEWDSNCVCLRTGRRPGFKVGACAGGGLTLLHCVLSVEHAHNTTSTEGHSTATTQLPEQASAACARALRHGFTPAACQRAAARCQQHAAQPPPPCMHQPQPRAPLKLADASPLHRTPPSPCRLRSMR